MSKKSDASAAKPSPTPASDQLIQTTARIECADASGNILCGTSFFFRVDIGDGRFATILVTNRHVVAGQATATVFLAGRQASDPSRRQVSAVPLPNIQAGVIYHPSPAVDLAAIPFAPIGNMLKKTGFVPEFLHLDFDNVATAATLEECCAFESLIMIGYPNGIWDSRNNRPILRRASSATPIYENYNNEAKFLIDCPCFPGSSGSPVFLFNEGGYTTRTKSVLAGLRVALVGVLHAGFMHMANGKVVQTDAASIEALQAQMTVPNSIGICIKASELGGLIEAVREKAHRPKAA